MATLAQNHERKYAGKPSYPFPVWNGLLEHCEQIGPALWEFLWCIDKVTKEVDGVGWVLRGQPVKLEEIAADLHRHRNTVGDNLARLEEHGYITRKRTSVGYIIGVRNSRKFGAWRRPSDVEKTPHLKSDVEKTVIHRKLHPDVEKTVQTKKTRQDKERVAARSDQAKYIEGAGPSERPVQLSPLLAKAGSSNGKPKSLPRWVCDPLTEDLYRGVHQEGVQNAFFDGRDLNPREQIAGCVDSAITDLKLNRVARCFALDDRELARRALKRLEVLMELKDWEVRQRQVPPIVTREVVKAAVEMLGKTNGDLGDTGPPIRFYIEECAGDVLIELPDGVTECAWSPP
jgi:hypothetical protein